MGLRGNTHDPLGAGVNDVSHRPQPIRHHQCDIVDVAEERGVHPGCAVPESIRSSTVSRTRRCSSPGVTVAPRCRGKAAPEHRAGRAGQGRDVSGGGGNRTRRTARIHGPPSLQPSILGPRVPARGHRGPLDAADLSPRPRGISERTRRRPRPARCRRCCGRPSRRCARTPRTRATPNWRTALKARADRVARPSLIKRTLADVTRFARRITMRVTA